MVAALAGFIVGYDAARDDTGVVGGVVVGVVSALLAASPLLALAYSSTCSGGRDLGGADRRMGRGELRARSSYRRRSPRHRAALEVEVENERVRGALAPPSHARVS